MEVYVSTDIEADGPTPGLNSMLSFASAAYTADKKLLATFTANLETLPDALPDPVTTKWWETQPEAWAACRRDLKAPAVAMREYAEWLQDLPGTPVFVGYPASFDFMFVNWYLMRFVGRSAFGFAALDVQSYAMALLKTGYSRTGRRHLPKRWFGPQRHTHIALDDAIEQGTLFCNMLAENLSPPARADSSPALLAALEHIVRADARLMQLLRAAQSADLPQCRVVAGCVYQTVWNSLTARPHGTGINDYDVIYFNDTDLSEEAESAVESRLRAAVPGFAPAIEVRNQARVHLWFEDHFGIPYPPLSSADESLTRYASTTHAVGVRLTSDDRFDVFAPFGLDDVFSMIVRPNYALPNKATHEKKAARARAVWPELHIIRWDDGGNIATTRR
jgi:hypothetical protein